MSEHPITRNLKGLLEEATETVKFTRAGVLSKTYGDQSLSKSNMTKRSTSTEHE